MNALHPIDIYAGLLPFVGMISAILISFALFVLHGQHQPSDYEHEPFLYQFWRYFVSPVARGLSHMGVTPNMVTLASLALSFFAMICVATGTFMAAAWLMVVSISCDTVDGFIARLQGSTSRGGAFLDSYIDRWAEGMLLGGMAYFGQGGLLTWLAIVGIVASFSVSYARARGEGMGVQIKVGWMQRPMRMALVIVGTVAAAVVALAQPAGVDATSMLTLTTALIAVGATITATRRAMQGVALLNERDAAEQAVPAAHTPALEPERGVASTLTRTTSGGLSA